MKLHDDISFYFLLTLFIRPAFVNLCRFVLILATAFPLLTTPELIEPLLPLSIHVLESILNSRSIVRFVSSQTMSIHRVGPAFDFYVALRFIAFYSCLRVYGVSTSGIWRGVFSGNRSTSSYNRWIG